MSSALTYKKLYKELIKKIPKEQIDETFRVNEDAYAEISLYKDDPFIGFIDMYYPVSITIPKDYIIIDIGCAYGFQSYYFEDFKQYIGVDPCISTKILPKNGIFYNVDCKTFITEIFPTLNICSDNVFCICSFVPLKSNDTNLLKTTFKNIFYYFPSPDHLNKI